jgi:hypothetical protein
MERDNKGRSEEALRHIQKLKLPSIFENFQEWKADLLSKYSAGFVVGIVIDDGDPLLTRVYFDGGRHRKINDHEGVVLEIICTTTREVVQKEIKVGDLVQTDLGHQKLKKIASSDELFQQGILFSLPNIDWESVIGAI